MSVDYRRRVDAELRAGRYEQARERCLEAVEAKVPDDYFRLTLARLAFVQNRRRDAVSELSTLLREVREAGTWARAGDLYAELGRARSAERCWRRAIVLDGEPRAWHRLIEALRRSGRDDEAEILHERLLARWPDDVWGLQERAAALFAWGRLEEAHAVYRRLPGAFDAYACAEILLRLQRPAEAMAACLTAFERAPSQPWAHYRAAQLAAACGEIDRAVRFIEEAGSPALAEVAATLLRRAGRHAEAEPWIALALGTQAEAIQARLRSLQDGACVLHGARDRHGWRVLRVRPVVYLAGDADAAAARAFTQAAMDALEAFHQRELGPHVAFAIEPMVTCAGDLELGFFRNAVEHQGFRVVTRRLRIPPRRKHECVVVVWAGDEGRRPAEGYGGYGYAVVRCAPDDPYAPTVLAHELYHATLALQHTDGDKDVLEAGGIMGHPGGMNRLADTYVCMRQRALCATFPAALRLVRRGHRHEEHDRWEEAARSYRDAVRVDPLYVYPAARLAQVEIHRGDYAEAERVMRNLLDVDDAPEHSGFLAHVLLDRGRIAEARRVLGTMRGVGSERALLLAGFTWGMSWHYRRALAAFRQALAGAPHSLAAMAGVAAAQASLGRLDASRRTYQRIVALDPYWAEAFDRLAVVEAERGDLDAAWQRLRRSRSLRAPGGLHHWARARVFGYAGRWDEALASIRRSLREEPHTMGARLLEPWVLVLLGRLEEARGGFIRCRDLERLSPCGRVAAAWVALLVGDPPTVLERHRRALARLARREGRLGSLLHAQVLLGGSVDALRSAEPGLPSSTFGLLSVSRS